MPKQTTINGSVALDGIGLHTGEFARITFKEAEPNTGVVFIRTDLDKPFKIKVNPNNVTDFAKSTIIGNEEVKVHTIEHVMSAFAGLGIDNVIVEISGPEPPVMDGSAAEFVKALSSIGIKELSSSKDIHKIRNLISLRFGESEIYAIPADVFSVSYVIEYPHRKLRYQRFEFTLDSVENYADLISPARTFCFLEEVDYLQAVGLARGGSLENAIVVDNEGILNDSLRFEDEFVRHKILDLIGDIYLLGYLPKMHIIAKKTSHRINSKFVSLLRQHFSVKGGSKMIEAKEIMDILPHRYPFLLVDRVIDVVPGKSAVGLKNVTINEPFFQGHFPGEPIMPGVLQIEAMAQTAGLILLNMKEHKGKLAYFATIREAKFRATVIPGDQLIIKTELIKYRGSTGIVKGEIQVEDKIVSEAEFMFTIVPRK